MEKADIEDIEIGLLKDAILKRYGYDFRHYSPASFKRRIMNFLSKSRIKSISEIIPRLIHDKAVFESLFYNLFVNVTEMFRDPFVYKEIRKKIIPSLGTYPFVKVWIAGCATGEEAISMAILLKEENMLDRCHIYATDINDKALEKARKGIYPVEYIKQYTSNYHESGGKRSFSEYYHSKYNSVIMNNELREKITFANHNLVSDFVFGEMHLIMCRNVLIYFDNVLQNRVLKIFCKSLIINGFLSIGTKESLRFTSVSKNVEKISKKENIYKIVVKEDTW